MQSSVFEEVDLFSDLSDGHRSILAEHAASRHFKKNAIVLTTGDESDSMYVVLKGMVRVYLDDDKGNEITLTTLGAGECFGELALLSGEPRVANVMTLEDCQFAVISKHDLMQILNDDPKIAFGVIRALVKRIQSMTEDISSLALLDVYGRLARTLNKSARERNGRMMTERMTQQDLANSVGASREMVSRILKDLKSGGYIRVENKRIILQRPLPTGW